MMEVCGSYVVVSPREVIKNACVVFDQKVARVELERGVSENVIVTHGLSSIHTHLGLYPLRSTLTGVSTLDDWVSRYVWPWERLLRKDPDLSYDSALLALSSLVLSGVTAVADMHFNEDKVAEAILRIGIRGDISIAIMSRGVYDSFEEALADNISLVKRFRGEPLISVRLGPTTPRLLSPHEFKVVVETAEALGVGVHTHIAEVPEDANHLRKVYGLSLSDFIGFMGLDRVNTIIAHGVWLDPESMRLLAKPNVTVAHCPSSNTLLRDGVAPVRKYIDAGIRVGLGVDVSPSYGIIDEIKMALSLHLNRGDLSLVELFEAAATVGYRALGIGSGRIEVGEVADLVVWSVEEPAYDPLATLISSGRVAEVYVSGRKIVEDGSILGASESEIRELKKSLSRYLKKCSWE